MKTIIKEYDVYINQDGGISVFLTEPQKTRMQKISHAEAKVLVIKELTGDDLTGKQHKEIRDYISQKIAGNGSLSYVFAEKYKSAKETIVLQSSNYTWVKKGKISVEMKAKGKRWDNGRAYDPEKYQPTIVEMISAKINGLHIIAKNGLENPIISITEMWAKR